jgi:N-acetyl-anhydromuramyl-L-alanine amidase AmpD
MTTERDNKPTPPPLPLAVPPSPEPRIVAAAAVQYHHRPAHLRNYSRIVREPRGIVLHCTDGCEGLRADEDCAAMFARAPEPGREKSAHLIIDANSCTRCVSDEFTAYHARHNGNMYGIGIELCGRADQTRAQWFDALSLPMLNIAARVCAELCQQHGIPAVVVNDRGLLAGERGITTHHFVSAAWKQSDHYDPGPGFPLGSFVAAVAAALKPASPPRVG